MWFLSSCFRWKWLQHTNVSKALWDIFEPIIAALFLSELDEISLIDFTFLRRQHLKQVFINWNGEEGFQHRQSKIIKKWKQPDTDFSQKIFLVIFLLPKVHFIGAMGS